MVTKFPNKLACVVGKRQGTLKVYHPNLAIYSRKFLDQLPNIHFKLYTSSYNGMDKSPLVTPDFGKMNIHQSQLFWRLPRYLYFWLCHSHITPFVVVKPMFSGWFYPSSWSSPDDKAVRGSEFALPDWFCSIASLAWSRPHRPPGIMLLVITLNSAKLWDIIWYTPLIWLN